ncbi:uncharacterized protein [Rutidosis leptorrhynchoides]|uniref:uncharacterized protein n=1 Tax=Rutidosis leptorrhynchoides TaxID=125765 RepID=UPI003A99CC33
MSYHIWSVITRKQSLWVKWIHSYSLKQRSIWEVDIPATSSYSWRKMLNLRHTIRPCIIHRIGSGEETSAWFDTWNDVDPLSEIITRRDIFRAGFSETSTVADLWDSSGWKWPAEWNQKYSLLNHISCVISSDQDEVLWRNSDGNLGKFSVNSAWDTIRKRAPQVNWHAIVWFTQAIPRHSFTVWLLMNEKLKTQDMLRTWDVHVSAPAPICLLCKTQMDSHNHLFFECGFSNQVWDKLKQSIQFHIPSNEWKEIVGILLPVVHKRVTRVVVTKLVFAASVYFMWQERNKRYFKSKARSVDQVSQIIISNVRLKLLSLKFKDSVHVRRMKKIWDIH